MQGRMSIQKQEFYEGAALHQLIRGSSRVNVLHVPPMFVLDERIQIHLKYSTAKRSPWGFTFTPDERKLMAERVEALPLVIGLICGADGVAALSYDSYASIAPAHGGALHLSCRRSHRERFEISGPTGILPGKVAPSDWAKLLKRSEA